MFKVVKAESPDDSTDVQRYQTPTGDFSKFDCDRCGACCKFLAVDADYSDVAREPKIKEFVKGEMSQHEFLYQTWSKYAINDFSVDSCQCAFLSPDNSCSIYATRPSVCVGFHAGSPLCQFSRGMAGLPMLLDRDGNPPDEQLSRAFASKIGGVSLLAYVDDGAIEKVSEIAKTWRDFKRQEYIKKTSASNDSQDHERN